MKKTKRPINRKNFKPNTKPIGKKYSNVKKISAKKPYSRLKKPVKETRYRALPKKISVRKHTPYVKPKHKAKPETIKKKSHKYQGKLKFKDLKGKSRTIKDKISIPRQIPTGKKFYNYEKILTNNNQVFYLKFKNNTQRLKILAKLHAHYEFKSFKDLVMKQKEYKDITYVDKEFKKSKSWQMRIKK
jgi:hypothetical protein